MLRAEGESVVFLWEKIEKIQRDDSSNIYTNDRIMKNYLLLITWLGATALNAQIYAIRNVNLIPMDGDYVRSQQTVLVEKGLITQVGETRELLIPKRARIIDGTGKYLMPGLMDMHVHFFTEQGISPKYLPQEAKLMLANGVTTARVMCGDSLYLDLKKRLARGRIPGPELFVVGPQLVGKWPFDGPFFGTIADTPEKARAAVEDFYKKGYDAVKITFFIQPDVYAAAVETARESGMPVTGHVGPDVGLKRALAAHQQIEHLDEFLEQLLPDSVHTRVSVSGTTIWDKKTAWPTVALLDVSKIPGLVKQVKASGISVTPTHHFLHSAFAEEQTEEAIRQSPDFQYIPKSLHADRFKTRKYYWQEPPPEPLRKKYVELRHNITRALHTAGVPLLCGSDAPEWFLVSGFAAHYELQALVDAGLTPFAALETATVNPAKYLGIFEKTGTIAVGKTADLLLLSDNPLEDIANTKQIEGLFHGGKYYDRKALDLLLEEAKVLGKQ